MDVGTVATASKILADAISALNSVRERLRSSKDADLKLGVSELYDNVLSLKEILMRISEENGGLRRRIAELESSAKREPELRQVGAEHFYFDGDKGPCCQPCYDKDKRLIVLTPPQPWSGGIRRECPVCHETFYEKPITPGTMNIRRRPFGR